MGSPEEEACQRLRFNPNLKEQIILEIQEALHANNPYIQEFKSALERMEDATELCVVIKADRPPPAGEQRGRYNAQKVNEIAVVLADMTNADQGRDIVLSSRGGEPKNVSEFHRSYDALQGHSI